MSIDTKKHGKRQKKVSRWRAASFWDIQSAFLFPCVPPLSFPISEVLFVREGF
jgi:hypothetical protein